MRARSSGLLARIGGLDPVIADDSPDEPSAEAIPPAALAGELNPNSDVKFRELCISDVFLDGAAHRRAFVCRLDWFWWFLGLSYAS